MPASNCARSAATTTRSRHFPSNGFVALEENLKTKRAQAVALGRGYAMGTLFAMTNPEAAIHILWEVFPQTKATGKDEATAMKDDLATLKARIVNWKPEAGGVKKWGENSIENYNKYVDFLVTNGVLKDKIDAKELVTNDLIEEINSFDAADVVKQAKAYK